MFLVFRVVLLNESNPFLIPNLLKTREVSNQRRFEDMAGHSQEKFATDDDFPLENNNRGLFSQTSPLEIAPPTIENTSRVRQVVVVLTVTFAMIINVRMLFHVISRLGWARELY